jgi:dipeptidyl aminopeptidase/acylaminoacyl peptidase
VEKTMKAPRTGARRCLFVHGDDDRNVPFQQTIDLVEKLRTQTVPFEELIIPDEIHDLLRWSDWVRAYRAIAEFFERRLASSAAISSPRLV